MHPEPVDILRKYWGYPDFRPGQEAIVRSILDGHDTLALLPTGGGKSICFQVPALILEGVCLVVSPLIALMKDQVQQLQKRGILAEALYAGLSANDIDRIVDNAAHGHLKFLYLSPERLLTDILQARLPRMKVSLIAVDEAHCISQWGYDFRPPYLRIAEIRDLITAPVPLLALTATATPEVARDIQDKLAFKAGSELFQNSFSRPNLAYVVRKAESKMQQLLLILEKIPGSAIIYMRSRKRCREIALELLRLGIPASEYHAGLDLEKRNARQQAWIDDKIRVMVATNAFGMGIDKPNVRVVIHLEPPNNPEDYFQEAGRAGRDGEKAFAVLLYQSKDRDRLHQQWEGAYPDMEEIRRVYRALGSFLQLATETGLGQSFDFDIGQFCATYQLDTYLTHRCLRILEEEEWLSVSESVYIPASVQIKVNKEQLYDYQLKNPKMDSILKVILRTYQGAFTFPVHLKESQLAKLLNMPTKELRQGLTTMHKAGIVAYQPVKDKPQITFLKDRVSADTLSINYTAYRTRKERAARRMEAMIAYCTRPICRSKQLLHYFGEHNAPECGHCDVCLERKKEELGQTDFERITYKIRQLLEEAPRSPQAIVNAFAPEWAEQVKDTLQRLIADERIRLDSEQRCHWS